MREFKINKNDAGQRLDKFILKTVKGMPMSLMYKYIRTKRKHGLMFFCNET